MQTFSSQSYVALLGDVLAEGYRFVTIDQFDPNSPDKQVILRHDVDYSPQKAVELAGIDHSLDVHSTFFFLLRGHWYNYFGHYTQEAIQQIHSMGFPIGLHYAPPLYLGGDREAHRQQLAGDLAIMRSEFPDVYPAFSWHVPPPLLLQQGGLSMPDGPVDMYAERFFRQAKYVSDSSLRNSYEYLRQVLVSGEYRKVQLLLHAECWLGSREMINLTDSLGEILRAIFADGKSDFKEKPDYRELLPEGIPLQMLDQIPALFEAAVHPLHNGGPSHRGEKTNNGQTTNP